MTTKLGVILSEVENHKVRKKLIHELQTLTQAAEERAKARILELQDDIEALESLRESIARYETASGDDAMDSTAACVRSIINIICDVDDTSALRFNSDEFIVSQMISKFQKRS